METIPVLIIGGGPVGLSMALALARQDIPSIVIERHPTTTNHPKARGVNTRTMELFRQWGNAPVLLKHEQPREAIRFIWAESLQGEEITRVALHQNSSNVHSPAHSSFVSQDHVEKSLEATIHHYPKTEIRFLRKLISFEQNSVGVTARILNQENHQEEFIHARYLIAADGAHSSIREQLKILMQGDENLGEFCSVYCEMDLSPWTRHRPAIGYFFTDPGLSGYFLSSINGENRWIMGMRLFEGDTKEKFSEYYCLQEIRRVLDLPDLKIQLLNKSFWTMGAKIADRYRDEKIFLVGDAAHVLPPTGGFGMNTGIQDAHNLAWKLAFVLKDHASEKLLDSYYEEREPIAEQNIAWSRKNATRYTEIYRAIAAGDKKMLIAKLQEQQANLNCEGLDLGFSYHSSILPSEEKNDLNHSFDTYHPTTLPGSRAPHMPLLHNGKLISTLDLFEKEFVLLVGREGAPWLQALEEIKKESPLPLQGYRIAEDGDLIDPDHTWHDLYEVDSTGAVLVRPDGHVAWRSKSFIEEPKKVLTKIFLRFSFLFRTDTEYSPLSHFA